MNGRWIAAALAMWIGAVAAAGAEMHDYQWDGMRVVALTDVARDPALANKPELLIDMTDAEKEALPEGIMANGVNCYIVSMGEDVVLFDTGFGGERGRLLESMGRAGFAPDDVTAVVITHFHPDHVGGLVDGDGAAVFSRARLMVPRVEVEAMARAAAGFMPAYAGRLVAFEWGQAVADGITAREAAGHTPGHTVFEVDAGESKLLIIADLIHFANIQLQRPEIAVTYDTDPVRAAAARRRIFADAAGRAVPVAGMHLPFPGVGKLVAEGEGYRFEVAE